MNPTILVVSHTLDLLRNYFVEEWIVVIAWVVTIKQPSAVERIVVDWIFKLNLKKTKYLYLPLVRTGIPPADRGGGVFVPQPIQRLAQSWLNRGARSLCWGIDAPIPATDTPYSCSEPRKMIASMTAVMLGHQPRQLRYVGRAVSDRTTIGPQQSPLWWARLEWEFRAWLHCPAKVGSPNNSTPSVAILRASSHSPRLTAPQ